MGSKRSKPRPLSFSFNNLSIRQQLPMLICLLLLSLILSFCAILYFVIRLATLGIGQARLRSLTEQLTFEGFARAVSQLGLYWLNANQPPLSSNIKRP